MRPRRFVPHASHRLPSRASASPPEVIVLAVRWYLRFGLSYRDVEELLAERGIEVDHARLKARLRPMRGLQQDRNAIAALAPRGAGGRRLER
jgi:hypothetical protein